MVDCPLAKQARDSSWARCEARPNSFWTLSDDR